MTSNKITLKELRRLVHSVIAEGPGRSGSTWTPPPAEGTIFLPTDSAIALWDEEILGQMSDGMWENARPYDHWKFWHELKVERGLRTWSVQVALRRTRTTWLHSFPSWATAW